MLPGPDSTIRIKGLTNWKFDKDNGNAHMNLAKRVARHANLTWKASEMGQLRTPPFLVLFINSICNLKCDHCFYWRNLNQRNDLSFDEIKALARDLGPFENLNLSGGEPF